MHHCPDPDPDGDGRGVPAGIFASIAVLAASDVFTAYLPLIGAQNDIGPRAVGFLPRGMVMNVVRGIQEKRAK